MRIGGVTLDNDLVWEDEFKFTKGAGNATNTIFGTLSVQTFPLLGYRPLTLVGSESYGWQKRSTVKLLQALVNNNPGALYTVEMPDGGTYSAMFRNEETPLEFTPITLATDPTEDFWYYGTVRMRICE